MVAGGRRERLGAGGTGLAVWALVACNVASLAFLVRGFVDGGRRLRGGGAVRSSGAATAPDGARMPEDEAAPEHAAVALAPDAVLSLELCVSTLATLLLAVGNRRTWTY
ncbi:hypothetical protein EJB05_33361, partial [Eragrostis curvula]